MAEPKLTISDVGEKRLIREFIKPFFNAEDDPCGVGDDCAMLSVGDDIVLLSTDRVPADLIAFRLGILDYFGLGDYLARLNLSDIAACGGRPMGLLLNLGLPASLQYEDVENLCKGFHRQARMANCNVLGGDITAASELSISATSVGLVKKNRVLTRRGAKSGDSIFVSRPLGLTPAAFEYLLGSSRLTLSEKDANELKRQFTSMHPMLDLGQLLGASGFCTSCMDNTDGIGQSLTELAEASHVAFVIDEISIPDLVTRVASLAGKEPREFIFDGGADFSLVGTLHGIWTPAEAKKRFGECVEVIGHVETGNGVKILKAERTEALIFKGWNYFL
jgi:thiamine-monophosphate kinase